MRYQSTEFHKFFWGINCCSYNTHGFHKIFAFRIFAKFRFVFALFIFAKKCEISRKSFRNATENFRIFSLNVSFARNPSEYMRYPSSSFSKFNIFICFFSLKRLSHFWFRNNWGNWRISPVTSLLLIRVSRVPLWIRHSSFKMEGWNHNDGRWILFFFRASVLYSASAKPPNWGCWIRYPPRLYCPGRSYTKG